MVPLSLEIYSSRIQTMVHYIHPSILNIVYYGSHLLFYVNGLTFPKKIIKVFGTPYIICILYCLPLMIEQTKTWEHGQGYQNYTFDSPIYFLKYNNIISGWISKDLIYVLTSINSKVKRKYWLINCLIYLICKVFVIKVFQHIIINTMGTINFYVKVIYISLIWN